jgi:pyruvate kinase
MDQIAREVESHRRDGDDHSRVWQASAAQLAQPHVTTRTEDAIAVAVCAAADLLNVPLIVCLTSSGFTARTIASYRPSVPILAVTPEPETFRQLALNWGVIPAIVERRPDYESMVELTREVIVKKGLAWPGDRFVVTAGVPFDKPGTTNLLRIETV